LTADTTPDTDIPGLINWAARYLEQSGVIKPRLNAEHLLSLCTGRSRTELYAYHDRPISRLEKESFTVLLRRRAAHEPLQYITGRKGFRYLDLEVDGRVLIPRPETEMLVERAVCLLGDFKGHPVVVDVGTGSGCIALSLARECPATVVYATDISAEALEVACDNARRLELDVVVSFSRGDLLDALQGELAGRIDLIVCNPPYVRESDFHSLPPEVKEHEPYISLVAGPSGTEVHLRLMQQATRWLAPQGWLLMEGGEDQVHVLAREAAGFGYRAAEVHKDLNGRPRVVEMCKGT
jgi:release factor glutamine methyltransferase